MTNVFLRRNSGEGISYVWFDEGEVASGRPKRWPLLYKLMSRSLFRALIFIGLSVACSFNADALTASYDKTEWFKVQVSKNSIKSLYCEAKWIECISCEDGLTVGGFKTTNWDFVTGEKGMLWVRLSKNNSFEAREGFVNAGGYGLQIVQKASPFEMTVTKSLFLASGGVLEVRIATENQDAEWKFNRRGTTKKWVEELDLDGVTRVDGYNYEYIGTGSRTMRFRIQPNVFGTDDRNVNLECSGNVSFLVTQKAGVKMLDGILQINYEVANDESQEWYVDGALMLSANNRTGSFLWQARRSGSYEFKWVCGKESATATFDFENPSCYVAQLPNPPMAKDNSISITPTTRNFSVGGGGNAILTSGSGTWTAAVSEPWLTLSSTSGAVGVPVAYTVTATTNIGQRVGYVYVSGHVHTVTQDGYEAAVSPTEITAESGGKTGTITLDSPGRYSWDARPNDDWLSITPTHGVASGVLTYQVAPYNEVATRSGSFTVGDKTVTVFQYGRRMKLSTYNETRDYFTHVIPITVNALAITSWSVTPNASWISVVDGGNGQGGDLVSIAIAENPSWNARTGTVTIGTETFTVTQEGRTALEFSISPSTATAAVSGGNGLLAVTATPDLPWTAKSGANWLTIVSGFTSGAGNGNVVYNASPNSTLNQRTGKITVTPVTGSGLNAKTLTVTQPAAEASVSPMGYEFPASGGPVDVEVTVNSIVEWSVDESLDWISVAGSTSRQGPGTVTISASANNTVYPRSGTIRIAGKTFSVSQKAHGVEIEYESKVFGVDGGMSSVSIHPDGEMSWTAVASDTWIVIFENASGTGDAEIKYILAPYEGDGLPRTGWIQVGDKKVYVTQRAYDLDITPRADWVTGNAGAGEIGVSAGLKDIWQAIITEGSWITIVSGYDATTGSGTVRFTYTENNTGKTRTGKIMIAGEVYTLTQAARILVNIDAEVVGGGTVSGAGTHTMGETATLTAIPNDGYEFLYWTGDAGETMQNPIRVTADVAKSVTAYFGPLTPEFTTVESSTEGVRLTWRNLAWATQYKIYRAPTTEFPTKEIVTLAADGTCTYFDTTGEVGTPYFYWVEAIGASDTTESKDAASGTKQRPIVYSSIAYTNLKGATHSNPSTYQEGVELAFSAPGAVTGYTFTGWEPAMITATMTGAQTVRATWKANAYQIVYSANGGSGTMTATDCAYDAEGEIAANGFTRSGYLFLGWATEENGEVVYQPGDKVTNLTSNAGGVVTLYAVWEIENVQEPVITPSDGSIFKTETCTVTITCATEGAEIYYSTNGRTPRTTEANRYTGPFTISDTATIVAVAVKSEKTSEYVEATIAKVIPEPLTLAGVLDEPKLADVATGGDAEWLPIEDETAKVGGSCAVSGALDDDGEEEATWLEAKVYGKGTLTFWWRVSCEPDPRAGKFTYDFAAFEVDDEVVVRKDGESDWVQVTKTFTTDGEHVIRWSYNTDGFPSDDYDGCVWVDGVTWSGSAAPEEQPKPTIEGDEGATVTGDAETGFVVKPSEGKTAVVVTIPQGVDVAKVTVEVSAKVASVKPNGAKVKIVNVGADITQFLNVPAADGSGVVDLTKATVKEEIVKEAMDVKKGAKIVLDAANPSLTTSNTREGLLYKLREGTTIGGMNDGDSKVGDGKPWSPKITVKGGNSAFYSIGVGKGE